MIEKAGFPVEPDEFFDIESIISFDKREATYDKRNAIKDSKYDSTADGEIVGVGHAPHYDDTLYVGLNVQVC